MSQGRSDAGADAALAVEKIRAGSIACSTCRRPGADRRHRGLDVGRFDAAMATLVRSVMLGMKHAAPYMEKQGSGSIITMAVSAGRLAGFSSSMSNGAAKAAVIHFTKCVAMELGESGIRRQFDLARAIATGIFGQGAGAGDGGG